MIGVALFSGCVCRMLRGTGCDTFLLRSIKVSPAIVNAGNLCDRAFHHEIIVLTLEDTVIGGFSAVLAVHMWAHLTQNDESGKQQERPWCLLMLRPTV